MAPCRKIYDEVVKEKTSESISKGQLVATYVSLIKSLVGLEELQVGIVYYSSVEIEVGFVPLPTLDAPSF